MEIGMTGEDAHKLLELYAAQLGEQFDAVQIMVSWNEDSLTKCANRGAGNWYARTGMAREFLGRDQAQEIANEISKTQQPPQDEGDDWKVPTL